MTIEQRLPKEGKKKQRLRTYSKPQEETWLAHTRISDQQKLEQIVTENKIGCPNQRYDIINQCLSFS